MYFNDRADAGGKLANLLLPYKNLDPVVYALPRGGVILGKEIAEKLGAPLDLVITRKIGHPYQKEYAVCAVAEDGDIICGESAPYKGDREWLRQEIAKERREAKRRREIYLGGRMPLSAEGKTAIIVDDGIATGLTMLLAIREIRHSNPGQVVVAVPVAPPEIAERIKQEADKLVALDVPEFYAGSIGMYYRNFAQVEDDEVVKILASLKKNG